MKRWPKVTILMPVFDQKESFLVSAIQSVLNQASPFWKLLIIRSERTPDHIKEVIDRFDDNRINVLVEDRPGLGGALNTGMKFADTQFVCILLSDDELAPSSVELTIGT